MGCLILPAGLLALSLCGLLVYFLPPVHSRLGWRVENAIGAVQRWLNPPEELVFVPQGGGPGAAQTQAQATLAGLLSTPVGGAPAPTLPAPTQGAPALPASAAAPQPTPPAPPTPTPAPTPLPAQVYLPGVIHEYQQFNNCGPTNLAMALSFWGWQGDQRATRAFLRPNLEVDDKNVNPAEMVAFVQQTTQLQALSRVGGDPDLLRRLIAAGFPVIVEAGHHPPKDWWMGHYLVVNGYDDAQARWTMQDSLLNPDLPVAYEDFGPRWWRDFNYVYVLIYPAERQAEVLRLLGQRADEAASYRLAEQRALEDIQSVQGRDLFFAWFNLGSSRVGLKDYPSAAQAYDQAFALYQQLSEDMRPYRLMWYQAGPYEAYYNTGRYQDVIALANTTFTWVGKPVLEESYYWRGRAYAALGQTSAAARDLQKAAGLNPNYAAPLQALQELGLAAP